MGIGGAAAPELFDAVNPGLECADTPGLSNEHPPSCFFKQPTMLRELSNTIRCLSDCCPGWVFLSSAKAKWPQSFFNALKLGAHFPRATMDYWWWYHSELNHNVRSDPRLVSGEKNIPFQDVINLFIQPPHLLLISIWAVVWDKKLQLTIQYFWWLAAKRRWQQVIDQYRSNNPHLGLAWRSTLVNLDWQSCSHDQANWGPCASHPALPTFSISRRL